MIRRWFSRNPATPVTEKCESRTNASDFQKTSASPAKPRPKTERTAKTIAASSRQNAHNAYSAAPSHSLLESHVLVIIIAQYRQPFLYRTATLNIKTRTIGHADALLLSGIPDIEASLLERLFDQAPNVAFFIKDIEGRYLAVNQSLLERHGYLAKEEVIGKRPSDICVGDFGRIPSEQDTEALKTGRPLINHLEMQWTQPHKPVWCFTTKLPIRDSVGTVIGLIGISRDVRAKIEPEELPPKFASALQAFERELPSQFSASSLAETCKLTPTQLARLTKRLFGLTPTQLIAKTRITAACQQLLETEDSVSAIAQRCGFWDHSAFTRAFRAISGTTPSAFRKRVT